MKDYRSIVVAAVFAGLLWVPTASAQNISVVSGNGQVLSSSNAILVPLVVKLTDANGNPLSGQTINWTAANFFGGNGVCLGFFLANCTNQYQSTTLADGTSTVYGLLSVTATAFNPMTQVTVSAAAPNGNSVTFTETALTPAPNTLTIPSLSVTLSNPAGTVTTFPGDTFSGAIGTVDSRTIQLHVAATNGFGLQAVPFAAVQLVNYQDPTKGPAVQCVNTDPNAAAQAGFATVLTDVNGNATCNVSYGGQPGTGKFDLTVGGVPSATVTPAGFWQFSPTDENNPTPIETTFHLFNPLNEKVSAPTVGSIKIIQGTGQSGNPGQTLATPLQVEVDSASGQPLSGVTINWTVNPATAAVLNIPSPNTDFTGRASANVTLSGGAAGTVTVTATVAGTTKSQSFPIAVTPQITVTSFTIVSGNNQTAAVNAQFAQPLVVQVATANGAPSGIPVQFVSSGPVSLSSTSATTDSNGRAQVNVTALGSPGPASVSASISGASAQVFSLTVASTPPPPTITAANFVNGADLQPNSLSPCSLGALVTPAGALPITSTAPTFPGLPVTNTNVTITFSNITAPILNVGTNPAGQQMILFQVPCTVTPGSSVPVTVNVGGPVGGAGANVNLAVGTVSPGIFQTVMSDNVARAVLVRPDGSYVSLQNPARRGETVVAYVTGLGPTAPLVGTGAQPIPGTMAPVTGLVIPGMAGQAVPLVSAQLSEDLPGVYVVAFQIPAGISTGNNVTFSIGIQISGGTVYSGVSKIPVQ